MTLFPACKLTIEDAERELHRPLGGSPSSGELAVVLALNGNRVDEARERLARDGGVRTDLRELIEGRLLQAVGGEIKAWTVHLPVALWDEYARLGRIANISVGQSLVAAIQRDAVCRRSAHDTVAALDESVRAHHQASAQVVEEARAIVQRLGAIQDLASRLTRLEKAVEGLRAAR